MLSRFRFSSFNVFTFSLALNFALLAFAEPVHAFFLEDWAESVHDFFSGPAVASDSYCSDYAASAVNDAVLAARDNCPGLNGGGRYSTNRNDHYWWCMGVTPKTSGGENVARRTAVDACDKNVGYCNDYAKKASEAARLNDLYLCGGSGGMWEPSETAHKQFCLTIMQKSAIFLNVSQMFLDGETSKRDAAVKDCRSRYKTKDVVACEGYATRAVSNASKYRELKCEYQIDFGRWNPNFAFHFKWCIQSSSAPYRKTEDEGRASKLAACVARGGGEPKLEPVVNKNSGAFPSQKSPTSQGLKGFVAPKSTNYKSKDTGTGSGGVYYSRSIDESAIDRLNGNNSLGTVSGNQGYIQPGARPAPKAPCNTCGRVISTETKVQPSPLPKTKALPAPPAPSMDNRIDYGGCAGCNKGGVFVQPR